MLEFSESCKELEENTVPKNDKYEARYNGKIVYKWDTRSVYVRNIYWVLKRNEEKIEKILKVNPKVRFDIDFLNLDNNEMKYKVNESNVCKILIGGSVEGYEEYIEAYRTHYWEWVCEVLNRGLDVDDFVKKIPINDGNVRYVVSSVCSSGSTYVSVVDKRYGKLWCYRDGEEESPISDGSLKAFRKMRLMCGL